MHSSASDQKVDLRSARRQRGVEAVLDAALELFVETNGPATAALLAERAGVSTSSLFRYFDSIDDLRSQAVGRFLARNKDLLWSGQIAEDSPLDARVASFVDLRVRAGATLGPTVRALKIKAIEQPSFGERESRLRSALVHQVDSHFEPELGRLDTDRRSDLTALVDATTSIDAFHILSDTHGRTPEQVVSLWESTLHQMFGAPSAHGTSKS